MPELSRFYGIIIGMVYNDHAPPHFHDKYGQDQGLIRIDDGQMIEGFLSARALRLVEEWRLLHVKELLSDWDRAQNREPLTKINPLE
jgi:hypothetical protein